MLTINPNDRIKVNEALEHPFLAAIHNHYINEEPVSEPVSAFDFDFELYNLTV